jgi:hypothetical protein
MVIADQLTTPYVCNTAFILYMTKMNGGTISDGFEQLKKVYF